MRNLVTYVVLVASLVQRGLADAALVYDIVGYNNGTYGVDPHQSYFSSNIISPLLQVNHWEPDGTDDAQFIFLTFFDALNLTQTGPLIYRADDLSLVYSDTRWVVAVDAHIAQFDDDPYLVFIEQYQVAGQPLSNCVLYDTSYNLAYNISADGPPNSALGLHECHLTQDGTAVIALIQPNAFNLSTVGGDVNGMILDNLVQEIDIATSEVLWTWRASDYFEFSDSFVQYNSSNGNYNYDYIHMNSIQKTAEGNFLISSRHCHAIIYVDGNTGEVIWQLGGKRNSFADVSDGQATDFAWQHHVRFSDLTLSQLTMFDNHNISSKIGCTEGCTRGRHLELDYNHMTARLVQEYYHPEELLSAFEGSYDTLESGNVFIGWGANPTFTEFTEGGHCVLDVQFDSWRTENGYPINYRAFKMDWKATPTWDPSIAVVKNAAYVSWNGATEVADWQLLYGESSNDVLGLLSTTPRDGFETKIPVTQNLSDTFVCAVALDKYGHVLGKTPVVSVDSSGNSTVVTT